MSRIAIWAWHSPYIFNLARALPEHTIYTLPTPYAPEGWLHHQRPQPENVETVLAPSQFLNPPPDLVIAQTGQDLETAAAGLGWEGPMLYLAHNHAALDQVSRLPRAFHEPLVVISEMKAQSWRDAGYTQPITVIPPGLPDEFYGGWTGKEPCILTVCNNIRRPLFDLDAWLEATHDLPTLLVGEGNEGIPGAVGPAKSWEELKGFYRDCRVYLSVNKAPLEDGYNLALLEAMAAGARCIGLLNPTVPERAWNESLDSLRQTLVGALEWWPAPAMWQGPTIEQQFPWEHFRANWRRVLEEVCG